MLFPSVFYTVPKALELPLITRSKGVPFCLKATLLLVRKGCR